MYWNNDNDCFKLSFEHWASVSFYFQSESAPEQNEVAPEAPVQTTQAAGVPSLEQPAQEPSASQAQKQANLKVLLQHLFFFMTKSYIDLALAS